MSAADVPAITDAQAKIITDRLDNLVSGWAKHRYDTFTSVGLPGPKLDADRVIEMAYEAITGKKQKDCGLHCWSGPK